MFMINVNTMFHIGIILAHSDWQTFQHLYKDPGSDWQAGSCSIAKKNHQKQITFFWALLHIF